jgi:hypothetical protein
MAEGGQHECMVLFCRDRYSHTTAGHRCSNCHQYGHGLYECGHEDKIEELANYYSQQLPQHNYCGIDGCKHPWSHKTEYHHCSKCGYNHSSSKCYIQNIEYFMEKYSHYNGCEDLINFDYHNFFRSVYLARSDCLIHIYINELISIYFIKDNNGIKGTEVYKYVHGLDVCSRKRYESADILRRQTTGVADITFEYNNVLNGLPPHSWPIDSWVQEQTGMDEIQLSPEEVMDMILDEYQLPSSNDETINNMIDSIEKINLNTKKCPLCRKENSIDKCYEMKGSSDKCTVCLDNNVQMFFSECGHPVVCKSCFELLV